MTTPTSPSPAADGGAHQELPDTILQFGTGNFLRAFVDLFVQEANDAGQRVGRIVAVQSTSSTRAASLNRHGPGYHVVVRGMERGEPVEHVRRVESIRRALVAADQWDDVLAVARSPHLRLIVSNTTEAGLALDDRDKPPCHPPRSFPAKLTQVLIERHRAGQPAPAIAPCELIERNADILRDLVLKQADAWSVTADERRYLERECRWLNTLVDRIVPGTPAGHPLLATDPLLLAAEPYALWAVESDNPGVLPLRHPAITVCPDVRPYSLRKIRILNGAHTALVTRAVPLGFRTVREAVADPSIAGWLRALLMDEVVPTLDGQVDEPARFAEQVLERFANPFLEHKLSDIAQNHEKKVRIRLVPMYVAYVARFGRRPRLLAEVLESTPS